MAVTEEVDATVCMMRVVMGDGGMTVSGLKLGGEQLEWIGRWRDKIFLRNGCTSANGGGVRPQWYEGCCNVSFH